MSLKKQLDRYKQHLAPKKEVPAQRSAVSHDDLNKAMLEAARNLGADIREFEGQSILVKEQAVPLSTTHGLSPLNDIFQAVELWQKVKTPHPLSTFGLSAEELIFFDTETTGLSSGAGHMIFLLGSGAIRGDQLVITQYFLPGPGHEAAFYYHFLSDVQSLTNLVTYNGKAFDWPRVKTRVQFVRDRVPKLPAFGHFDLLHAARRLWKQRLDSVRLTEVEETILHFKREGDIPGHMAPFLYFEFLKKPKASLIEGIFRHNADDIQTLVALYSHLTYLIHGAISTASVEELYQIGRWYASLGQTAQALNVLDGLLDTASHPRALRLLGDCYKKVGDASRAFEIYNKVIEAENDDEVDVLIELAKLCEHHFKDYKQAWHFANRALEQLQQASGIITESEHKDKKDVQYRIERLKTKMARSVGK